MACTAVNEWRGSVAGGEHLVKSDQKKKVDLP
jgi:hypothetical protein